MKDTPSKLRRREKDADVSSTKRVPATPDEIRSASHSGDVAALEEALKRTRNFLTIRPSEGAVSPDDARVQCAKEWLQCSPSLTELFGLLDRAVKPSVTSLALAIMAHQLNLISSHFIYHSLGQPIVKKLVSHMWLRRIESYLSSSHSDLTFAALKLLLAMSRFAGGKEQKTLLEAFVWDSKLFTKLLFMQRGDKSNTSQGQSAVDFLDKPDIRTLTLQFILSFISAPTSHLKTLFLEQHRDVVQVVFKRICAYPYSVVKFLLETIWTDLWQDRKVKRTLKVGLFNEATISLLLKLYERDSEEDNDPEYIPANLVHHFLLGICTHRGVGICFPDNGWYPRPSEDAVVTEGDSSERQRVGRNKALAHLIRDGGSGKIFNKILANVLKALKVNEDARQQELALKILAACPELVAGYIQSAGITLEPRLSSKWLANISFFGSVVSLCVPKDSFLLKSASVGSSLSPQYNPTPPQLPIILENILPSLNLKMHFSKGLQSASPLVQHSTALVLVRCLMKLENVRDQFREVSAALGEDEGKQAGGGLWVKRWEEVETEARKRVPEVQVIIAFSQQKHAGEERTTKSVMLSEVAKRLLWQYHRCFPSLIAEVRFDVGRLLQDVVDAHAGASLEGGIQNSEIAGFDKLKKLHVLRILEESDQLTWSGRAGTSSRSNFFVLVSMYLSSEHDTIRNTLASVLMRTFSESLLFQHDPAELKLWLDALPRSARAKDAQTLEGTPLTDEGEGVLNFLDDCVQRCAKATHRYMEEMEALASSASSDQSSERTVASSSHSSCGVINASPLLMTVWEQLLAKLKAKLLSPSDLLAITTFIRVLVVSLLGKQPVGELDFFVVFADRFIEATQTIESSIIVKDTGLLDGCMRQGTMLRAHVQICLEPGYIYTSSSNASAGMQEAIEKSLSNVEGVPLPEAANQRKVEAYELIDWTRLVNPELGRDSLLRLSAILRRFHALAIRDLCYHVDLSSEEIWKWLAQEPLLNILPLDHLLLAATTSLRRSDYRKAMLLAVKAQKLDLYSMKRYCGLLMHRLATHDEEAIPTLLDLMADMVEIVLPSLDATIVRTFKRFVLGESSVMKALSCDVHLTSTGLVRLVNILADAGTPADVEVLSSTCFFWVSELHSIITQGSFEKTSLGNALLWIKYMTQADITRLFSELLSTMHAKTPVQDESQKGLRTLVEELLVVLSAKSSLDWLQQHISGLIMLRQHVLSMQRLDDVLDISVNAGVPVGVAATIAPEGETSLSAILEQAELRWSLRMSQLPDEVTVQTFLISTPWSKSVSGIITGLLYRSERARQAYQEWLFPNDTLTLIPSRLLAPTFQAFLETASETSRSFIAQGDELQNRLLRRLWNKFVQSLLKDSKVKLSKRTLPSCMAVFFSEAVSLRKVLAHDLCAKLSNTSPDYVSLETLELASAIKDTDVAGQKICHAVINHGLQWVVRFLSGPLDIDSAEKRRITYLCSLVRPAKIKAAFAEPVIQAATQDQASLDQDVLRLLDALFLSAELKPANVNRYLQGLWQHRQLQSLSSESIDGMHDAFARLLHTIFHTHPNNTCQASHISPLIQLYGGTLSSADRHILGVLRLFESQRRLPVSSLIAIWSAPKSMTSQTCLDALSYLEPGRVLRTCMSFPVQRSLHVESRDELEGRAGDEQIYDPVFVMLLFAQTMSSCPPSSALGWVQMFRTNAVSLIFRCLSSRDQHLRSLAHMQLKALYKHVEIADMHEKPHVLHLLGLLRDAMKASNVHTTPRLPSYSTLMLAHSLRGVFYPSNFMYPITARFLLQRPELDLYDVPLLYSLLYSHDDNWKKERGWIIKFLSDGLISSSDWLVFKRRHTWELLASMYQSSPHDRPLRHGILQVLTSLSRITQAITSLILRSSLLAWVDMQTQSANDDECIAWARIIENVTVNVDAEKLDKSTRGEWRSCLFRCLTSLLRCSAPSVLHVVSRTILRLSVSCPSEELSGAAVFDHAIKRLRDLERGIILSPQGAFTWGALKAHEPLPPHGCHDLFQEYDVDKILIWGEVVENLWKASMSRSVETDVWSKLTSRLLVWISQSGSNTAGWARDEVVSVMSTT